MNADDAKGASALLSPFKLAEVRQFVTATGTHLAEHEVFPTAVDGTFASTDARHANLEHICEGMLRQCIASWSHLVELCDHVAALGTDQDTTTSIRLVLGHHGAPQGIQPPPWQQQLIELIEAGDTLQRAELATAYPGLVSAVVTYESDGINALYLALALRSLRE